MRSRAYTCTPGPSYVHVRIARTRISCGTGPARVVGRQRPPRDRIANLPVPLSNQADPGPIIIRSFGSAADDYLIIFSSRDKPCDRRRTFEEILDYDFIRCTIFKNLILWKINMK